MQTTRLPRTVWCENCKKRKTEWGVPSDTLERLVAVCEPCLEAETADDDRASFEDAHSARVLG